MAYVNVDVDMSDFDTDELVDELVKRFQSTRVTKKLTAKQIGEIKRSVEDLLPFLNMGDYKGVPNETLEDKMKRDAILSVWDKLTSFQIEERLKL